MRVIMIIHCQDTGAAVFFIEVGQDVHITGGSLKMPLMRVRRGYTNGYLRKSMVLILYLTVKHRDNTPP